MRHEFITTEHAERCMQRLGVSFPLNEDELKSAYREKARETHPDHGGNTHDFIAVKEAYDYLMRWRETICQHNIQAQAINGLNYEIKDKKKNYGPCHKCKGLGKVRSGFFDEMWECAYCHGTGEVELFNPVISKMKMGNVKQQRKTKKNKTVNSGRFVNKEYI